MNCAFCQDKGCFSGKDCLKNGEKIKKLYTNDDINLLEASSAIEARYYMEKHKLKS